MTIEVEGLKELRKALKACGDVESLSAIKAANKAAGDHVVTAAKGRASGVSKMAAKASQSLRATNTVGGAAVKIGSARYPFALGAEFGSKRFRQFEPWRGSGATAGYFMWPSIRDEVPKLIGAYGDAIEKAFTDD